MSKPKFLKPVIIGCACLVPVGLIVGLSVNWDHTQNISCIGSGGVKPYVEAFGNEFIKHNSDYDVTVESGGSTFGATQVANGYCNLGNASKNPYSDVNSQENSLRQQWTDNSLKTVTLGWEAVGVLYIIPNGLSQTARDHFDLCVSEANINYLYAAFSGFNEIKKADGTIEKLGDKPDVTSYYEFLTDDAKNHMTLNEKRICMNTQIVPFVRSGGGTVANSSLSFATESHFDKVAVTDNQYMAFKGGQYGSDRTVIQTDESNAKGYEIFDSFKLKGSMVYLTSAFTEPTKTKEIIASNSNYRFMSYKPAGKVDIYKYDYNNFANGYEWVRPLNVMCSMTSDKAEKNKKFLTSIFTDNYDTILKNNGAMPLTEEQKQSMCIDGNFWVDDITLEQQRSEENKDIYGAIK